MPEETKSLLERIQYLEANCAKVGDVRFSVLAPREFTKRNKGWVLMDGRDVSGSEYHKLTQQKRIPNAKNQFIRGMGGKFDKADGNLATKLRTAGSVQSHSTARPRSAAFSGATAKDGKHQHNYQVGNAVQGHKYKTKGGEFWRYPKRYGVTVADDKSDHKHAFAVTKGGDRETRPTNVALYIYIKIN